MTHDDFITEYRSSENRVPVNNELKAKLIAMAKELEENNEKTAASKIQPTIKISRTRRVRHMIMEISAIAACAALCAYAIPNISDRYFNRFDTNPIPAVTNTPLATQTPHEEDQAVPTPQTETARQVAPSVDNNTNTSQRTTTAPPIVRNNQANTNSQNNVSQHEPDTKPAEVNKQADDILIPEIKSNDAEVTRSDLNSCLENTSKNLTKLEAWDNEISQYAAADEITAQYYSLYTESRQSYVASAAEFEQNYDDAIQSSLMYEGYEAYTNVLEPKFDNCRSSYRKAKNYIEINIIGEVNEQTDEAIETDEQAEAAETEEAVEPEESNE